MLNDPNKIVTAIIVAAGRGVRAGGEKPKQWQSIAGKSVADWTLQTFQNTTQINHIVFVIDPADPDAETFISAHPDLIFTHGGATRDASVHAGLDACPDGTTHVLIHDVARPCISNELINSVLSSLTDNVAAAPALAVTDALWTGEDGWVTGTTDRTGLFRAQTPQGFEFTAIKQAHKTHPGGAADDIEVARASGIKPAIVPGDPQNIKITTPSDFTRAERFLHSIHGKTSMDIRVGNGFDVHRFGPGDHVTLCGIDVPHNRGLQGHSDADVGLHTITDAIYGALSQGDIGQHFPPSDPQWEGAASHIFLEHARDLAKRIGFRINHVDCTLICEHPKIGPHTLTMRYKVSELLEIPIDSVSVKATTSERLGFTGREEGIACIATTTLVKT